MDINDVDIFLVVGGDVVKVPGVDDNIEDNITIVSMLVIIEDNTIFVEDESVETTYTRASRR